MRLRASLNELADWFLACDPELNRLRLAARGVVAVATELGVARMFGRLAGARPEVALIAMLLGAIVAMKGSMTLSKGGPAAKAVTAASFPAAIGSG